VPEPLAYLNDAFMAQRDAHLPLNDAGFIFGATVTDLCRTFRHVPFRLSDHLARFRRSCVSARIAQTLPDSQLMQIAEKLVSHNATLLQPEQDLALVMFATPGPIGYYAGLKGGLGDGQPTLGMHTFPLPFARYVRFFQEGVHLVVPHARHVPVECVDPRVKQRSRLGWWIAEQEVQRVEPGAIALLLDMHGKITETASANFLLVREGLVLSPPRESILGGISLLTVKELCAELKLPFEERPLTLCDCLDADEAFLSGTSFCLAGVSRINGTSLTWPGPIFERLLNAWCQRVGVDIRQQICSGR
jgi:branched-subunit amino acid aminotransferase/4-amino-4-deoxychorismate lyase